MDEFKPEDELKPDASDRPAARTRKPTPTVLSKLPLSKQHIMMAVGILVLLLLILVIGSALKGSASDQQSASANGESRSIDLGANSGNASQNLASAANSESNGAASPTSIPSTPEFTGARQSGESQSAPESQRSATQMSEPSENLTLPVGPATLDPKASLSTTTNAANSGSASVPAKPRGTNASNTATHHSAASHHAASRSQSSSPSVAHRSEVTSAAKARNSHHTERRAATPAKSAVTSSVAGQGYTLQLSGAGRSDTLQAWAKQQQLTGYQVVKTLRNGQPWYVLIQGSYATPAAAKQAISRLPAAARAKSPWVKPMSQLKKEAAQ